MLIAPAGAAEVTQFGYMACAEFEDLQAINDTLRAGDPAAASRLMEQYEAEARCVTLPDGMQAEVVHDNGEPARSDVTLPNGKVVQLSNSDRYVRLLLELADGEPVHLWTKPDAVR